MFSKIQEVIICYENGKKYSFVHSSEVFKKVIAKLSIKENIGVGDFLDIDYGRFGSFFKVLSLSENSISLLKLPLESFK